jgi:glycosyltransferase involved in cell wall biosynthesis
MRIVRYYPRALVGDGGMTGAVRAWSAALVRAGASVTVAFERGAHPPHSNDDVKWAPVSHKGRGSVKVPIGLERVLQDADLLVLHSGWTLHNIRAAAVARRMGVPYLLEPRGAYDPHIVRRKWLLKKLWWVALERELVSRARAIHVFFESERAHLTALGYQGEVIVASNGATQPNGTRWDGGTGGYILWLGRFDPQHKGLDLLLHGLWLLPADERPMLRIQGPDWRGKKGRVRRMVSRMGLDRWVTVGEAAYGGEKRTLLSRARGFVYPSRWDACPNSVLEAVSIGLPTLVTPYPLGQYLAGRQGAVLAEPTPEGLAAGLGRLVAPTSSETGRVGSRLVAEELSWDHVARTWLSQVKALS